ASRSATDELPELVVGDQPALAGSELLHSCQHLRAPLLGNVHSELVGLDPDRIESTLLAEHDPALGVDELGGVGLDRGRVVELARDGAALAPEECPPRHRLPGLERVARELADTLGDLANPFEP